MSSDSLIIWLFLSIGSFIGGYLPSLWGAGMFSFSSIIFSTIGGLAGVWVGYKLSRYY
ncbi:MAG: hypothetical protein WCQ96_02190 [Patescibacteria group bacterium]